MASLFFGLWLSLFFSHPPSSVFSDAVTEGSGLLYICIVMSCLLCCGDLDPLLRPYLNEDFDLIASHLLRLVADVILHVFDLRINRHVALQHCNDYAKR